MHFNVVVLRSLSIVSTFLVWRERHLQEYVLLFVLLHQLFLVLVFNCVDLHCVYLRRREPPNKKYRPAPTVCVNRDPSRYRGNVHWGSLEQINGVVYPLAGKTVLHFISSVCKCGWKENCNISRTDTNAVLCKYFPPNNFLHSPYSITYSIQYCVIISSF